MAGHRTDPVDAQDFSAMSAAQKTHVEETLEQRLERLDLENRELLRIREVVVPQLESRIRRYEAMPECAIITDLEERLKDNEALVQELQQHFDELNKRKFSEQESSLRSIAPLEEEKRVLQSQLHELQRGEQHDTGEHSEVIAQLEEKLKDSEALVQELQQHLDELNKKFSEQESSLRSIAQLEEEKLVLQSQLHELHREEQHDTGENSEVIAQLEEKLKDSEALVQELQEHIDELNRKFGEQESALRSIAKLEQEKRELQSQLHELQGREQHDTGGHSEVIAQLEEKLRDSEEVVRMLQEHVESSPQQLRAVNNNLEETEPKLLYNEYTQEEARQYRDEACTYVKLYANLKDEYGKRLKTFESRELELCEMRLTQQLLDDADKKIADMETEMATKDEDFCIQHDAYNKLVTEHEDLKLRFHALETEFREVRDKHQIEEKEELSRLKKFNENLEAALRIKTQEIQDLTVKLDEVQSNVEHFEEEQEELWRLKKRNENLEAAVRIKTQEIQELTEKLDEFQTNVEHFEASMNQKAREVVLMEEEVNLWKARYDKVVEEKNGFAIELQHRESTLLRKISELQEISAENRLLVELGSHGSSERMIQKLSALMSDVSAKRTKIEMLQRMYLEEQQKNIELERKVQVITAAMKRMEEEGRGNGRRNFDEKLISTKEPSGISHTEAYTCRRTKDFLEKERETVPLVDKVLGKNTEAASVTQRAYLWAQAGTKTEETPCSPVITKQKVETPSPEAVQQALAKGTLMYPHYASQTSTWSSHSGPQAYTSYGQTQDFQSMPCQRTGSRHPHIPALLSPLSLLIGRASATPLMMHHQRPGFVNTRPMPYDTHSPKEADV